MKESTRILLVIPGIIFLIVGLIIYHYSLPKLKECPDEKIIAKSSIIGDTQPQSYYIKNGKREEIIDYDGAWVEANCKIPTREVF